MFKPENSFISLKVFIDRLMLHYDTNTGPLNRIQMSYHGKPNFLENCDEYISILGIDVNDDGLGCTYGQYIEDMDINWIKDDSYCAKYCTIKRDCFKYQENTTELSPEEVERRALEYATIQLARGRNQ